MDLRPFFLLASSALLAAAGPSLGQGCDALPPASDFAVENLATADGWPYDIQIDAAGKVYWIERLGAFKVLEPATKKVTLLNRFDVLSSQNGTPLYDGSIENGLEGMALDPDFAANGWVYIWRTLPASAAGSFKQHELGPIQRLARFTLKANGMQLDTATERPIFEHRIVAQCCHYGGSMRIGKDGILYLSTGDNTPFTSTGTGTARAFDETNQWTDPRNTSSNTNDTRGKVLRIKPLPFPDAERPAPGIGSTYSIPAGNLRETWVTPEKDKVRPEIWSMGHRNPFSISLHPDKPWIGIGEANGDNPQDGDDEINIVTKAGYSGWPFVIGANQNYIPSFWSARGQDPSASAATGITNDSRFNTGAKVLPPATPAAISGKHGLVNMPMYCLGVVWGWVDYDGANPNRGKFPPYLKGKLLLSGWGETDLKAATVDENGKVAKLETLFPNSFGKANGSFTSAVMRATQGPDGAFYVSKGMDIFDYGPNSGCRIFKVSYKGSCSTVSLRPSPDKLAALSAARTWLSHLGTTEVPFPAGIRRMRAYDPRGRLAWEAVRSGAEGHAMASIPPSVPAGALQLRYLPE